MCGLILLTTFTWNISRSKKNSAKYCNRCENVFMYGYSCRSLMVLEFFRRIFEKGQISNVTSIKIYLVWAELFYADRQTDRQTDRHDELVVAVRSLANAPKNKWTPVMSSGMFHRQIQGYPVVIPVPVQSKLQILECRFFVMPSCLVRW